MSFCTLKRIIVFVRLSNTVPTMPERGDDVWSSIHCQDGPSLNVSGHIPGVPLSQQLTRDGEAVPRQ